MSPAAAFADSAKTEQCGGMALFQNTCENDQILYVRVCKGKAGAEGKTAFKLQSGGVHQIVVPQYSTYLSYCSEAPPAACDGQSQITVEACE